MAVETDGSFGKRSFLVIRRASYRFDRKGITSVPCVCPLIFRGGDGAGPDRPPPECDMLDRLVAAVRAGESRALVVHGEPGVGKTALLEYLAGQASGCRVAHAGGVQSEMELAFAVLHQLCAPMLDRLERLPRRSETHCGPHWASARARRRTGS